MSPRVVNSHKGGTGDLDITRRRSGMHFGNPFSHSPGTLACVRVASREDAVTRYRSWLRGETDLDLEPERRAWILECLPALTDAVLVCRCKPAACHGDVLVELIEETRKEDAV